MFMLDGSGVGGGIIAIINDSVALMVLVLVDIVFKVKGSIFQLAVAVVKEFVNAACVHNLAGQIVKKIAILKIIGIESHLDACQHALEHGGVTADRDTLVAIVEVVVIEGEAQR